MYILSPAFVRRRSPHSLVFGLIAAFLSPSPSAHGQPADDPFAAGGKPSAWAVMLGAGAAIRPTFEGSDRYFVSPVPLVSINYNDMISLDTSGLSAYWRKAGLQIGGGLTYNLGRRQGGNNVFTPGDERLNGLGDIPAAPGLRAFANYQLGPVVLGATLTKYLAEGNNGLLIDALVEMPYRLGERTTVTGRVFATWADQSYMQTWFGVTPRSRSTPAMPPTRRARASRTSGWASACGTSWARAGCFPPMLAWPGSPAMPTAARSRCPT
jgi:MipA family protein